METIPVADTFIGEEEAKAVSEVVKSRWLSMGKKVKKFEEDFRDKVDADHAIAVNNGTSALHVALAALGVKKGDEVILPSLTFISTANSVLYQNAKPVLVECDPKTYNTTAKEIEKHITDNTKAIIPVDMNGMPVDYDSILKVADEHSIPVILDSAESLGAEYKNKKIGGIAPIQMFSFFPNKNITTGEGGMITCNDEKIVDKMRKILNQGQDYRYHHVVLGYNYRMTELQAAIGIEQLKRLQWVVEQKEKIAQTYNKAFEKAKNIDIPFVPDYVTQHAWYMYAISVKKDRDKIVEALDKKGIQTRLSFPPIHIQPIYKEMYGYSENTLPVTYNAWKQLIDIPIYAELSQEKQQYIIDTLLELCED